MFRCRSVGVAEFVSLTRRKQVSLYIYGQVLLQCCPSKVVAISVVTAIIIVVVSAVV